ncbi:MAG: hypothetical protein Q9184_001776 [Pyrenodesmia sp. 2 TL-2023]
MAQSPSIKCNHYDNFARSLPSTSVTDLRGAVVDGGVLNRTLAEEHDEITTLPDLKTQVAQWLRFEKKQYTSSRRRERRNGGPFSPSAIRQSIDSLFEQLGVIADSWPLGTKIILPEAMDPTFLPAWSMERTGPSGSDHSADDQRNAVQLVKQWNAGLDLRASDWHKAQIYIYNTNEWMLNQVRERQLILGGHVRP